MDILLAVSVCGMASCVFMLVRNQIVYSVRMKWIRLVGNATDIIIDHDLSKYEQLIKAMSYSEILELIGSYNAMMLKFWCWNMRSFFSGNDLKMHDQFCEIVELGKVEP